MSKSYGSIEIKVDLNDYLIPATKAKRFKGLYYIRVEEEYTGDLKSPRKEMYTLERCKGKRGDELISEYYKRTPIHKCWIVKPELKIEEYWTKSGSNLPESFSHIEDVEEVKSFMSSALMFS